MLQGNHAIQVQQESEAETQSKRLTTTHYRNTLECHQHAMIPNCVSRPTKKKNQKVGKVKQIKYLGQDANIKAENISFNAKTRKWDQREQQQR